MKFTSVMTVLGGASLAALAIDSPALTKLIAILVTSIPLTMAVFAHLELSRYAWYSSESRRIASRLSSLSWLRYAVLVVVFFASGENSLAFSWLAATLIVVSVKYRAEGV